MDDCNRCGQTTTGHVDFHVDFTRTRTSIHTVPHNKGFETCHFKMALTFLKLLLAATNGNRTRCATVDTTFKIHFFYIQTRCEKEKSKMTE